MWSAARTIVEVLGGRPRRRSARRGRDPGTAGAARSPRAGRARRRRVRTSSLNRSRSGSTSSRSMSSGSPPTLWWLLILAAVPRAALDHVGVQRPLDEEPRAPVLARDLLEHADELLADRLALVLGVGDARRAARGTGPPPSRARAAPGSAGRTSPRPARARPRAAARCRRTRRSAVADRLVHEQRRHRRVHAARRARRAPRPSPTWARIARDRALDRRWPGSSRAAGRTRRTGTASSRPVPCGVCATSGWNWTANRPRSGSSIAAIGIGVGAGRDAEPLGARVTASPWLIHTCSSAARSSSRTARLGHVELGPAVLALPRRARPRRRAPAPSAGARSRSRAPGRPARTRRGRGPAPPPRTPTRGRPTGSSPAGARAASSAAVTSCGTISE